jgi:hypothetical protein
VCVCAVSRGLRRWEGRLGQGDGNRDHDDHRRSRGHGQ